MRYEPRTRMDVSLFEFLVIVVLVLPEFVFEMWVEESTVE